MRRVPESELETDFERQFAWGDDERHLYNPNRRKAAVMAAELRLETVISLVNRFATTGKTVGDFASAQGNFGLLLAEQGYQVTAVDIKPEFLNYSLKKHTHGKFETVLANIIEYRHHQPFDVVLLGEIIEHVAFPLDLLKSAYENLKPGGILVLTTPNGNEFGNQLPTYSQVTNIEELIPKQFHWGDHLFLYTDSELSNFSRFNTSCSSANVASEKANSWISSALPMIIAQLIFREKHRTDETIGIDNQHFVVLRKD